MNVKTKKKTNMLIIVLLVFLLAIGMIPVTVVSAAETYNPVTVGNVTLNADSCYALTNEDGTVTTDGASTSNYNIYYDVANYTLYLNNATIKGVSGNEGAIVVPGDTYANENAGKGNFSIVYEGTNTIDGKEVSSGIEHNTFGGLPTLNLSAGDDTSSLRITGGKYAISCANLIMTGGTVDIKGCTSHGIFCGGLRESKISGAEVSIDSSEETGVIGVEVYSRAPDKFLIENSTIFIDNGATQLPAIAVPITKLEITNSQLDLTSGMAGILVQYGECELDSCSGEISAPYGIYNVAATTTGDPASTNPFTTLNNCNLDLNGSTWGIYTTEKINITGIQSLISGSDCTYVLYHNAGSSSEANIDYSALQGLGIVQGSTYYVWGNYDLKNDMSLSGDMTIEQGAVFTIPNGKTLSVENGKAMNNKGTVYVCGTLNAAKDGNPINEHKYEDDNDCTTPVTCELCQTTVIEAKTHNFVYQSNNNATCTQDGTKTGTCSNDGCNQTSTIPDENSALGHDWGEPVWSWSKDGTTATVTFTCKNDNSHTAQPTVAVTSSETPAGCTNDGKIVYTATATFDNQSYISTNTVTVPATGHSYSYHEAVSAECEKSGMKAYYTCENKNCGLIFDENKEVTTLDELVVSATGHSYVYHEAVSAECEKSGMKAYYTCENENCGLIFDENKEITTLDDLAIDATGHTFLNAWKTDEEKHWHECSCGAKTEEAAHTFEWKIDKDAEVGVAGTKHEECTACGYAKEAVEIPALKAPEYPPVIDDTDGGRVTVTPENPQAGEKVTITAKPETGKEIDKVIVTDENGQEISVTDNKDGTYSFVQPDGRVTVKVTFKAIEIKPATDKKSPQTGDNSNTTLWLAVLLGSGTALTGTAFYSRKKKYSR